MRAGNRKTESSYDQAARNGLERKHVSNCFEPGGEP
jgi:hypothetical protein